MSRLLSWGAPVAPVSRMRMSPLVSTVRLVVSRNSSGVLPARSITEPTEFAFNVTVPAVMPSLTPVPVWRMPAGASMRTFEFEVPLMPSMPPLTRANASGVAVLVLPARNAMNDASAVVTVPLPPLKLNRLPAESSRRSFTLVPT